MNSHQLLEALQLAADAMRRSDPTWCVLMGVEPIDEIGWDACLAKVEDALDDHREAMGRLAA
jgi:hypothetical protein